MGENATSTRIAELRRRFSELQGVLGQLRDEWMEAHNRRDVGRETELIRQETKLFDQVNEVITEFSKLMRYRRPSG